MTNFHLQQIIFVLFTVFSVIIIAAPAPRIPFNPPTALPGKPVQVIPTSVKIILPNGVQFPISTNTITVLSRGTPFASLYTVREQIRLTGKDPGAVSSYQVSDPSVYGCCIDIEEGRPLCSKMGDSDSLRVS
jgi:hypothetical protein